MSDKQRARYSIELACMVYDGAECLSEHAIQTRFLGERGKKDYGIGDADHLSALRENLHKVAVIVVDAAISKSIVSLVGEDEIEKQIAENEAGLTVVPDDPEGQTPTE